METNRLAVTVSAQDNVDVIMASAQDEGDALLDNNPAVGGGEDKAEENLQHIRAQEEEEEFHPEQKARSKRFISQLPSHPQ